MATRVAPRSNASSASSSSTTSSRRAYQKPSFGKDRDSLSSDPWGIDGRSAFAGKQHNRGHWSQKSHQAATAWGNSSIPIAEENESRVSWRSQKQAVDSFSNYLDSGRLIGAHQQVDGAHVAVPFPSASSTSRRQWNRENHREQNFFGQQSRPPSNSEQPTWERHQPNFTKQNHHASDRFTRENWDSASSNLNHNQGYLSGKNANSDFKFNGLPGLNLNQNSASRGVVASFQQDFRNDPVNAARGEHRGHFSNRQVAGRSIPGSERISEVQRAHAHVLNTNGLGEKLNNFPPLTSREETAQNNEKVASTPHLATDRAWEGTSTVTGRWADECNDDAPLTHNLGTKVVTNEYKSDPAKLNPAATKGSVTNSITHSSALSRGANRDGWRQNRQQIVNATVVSNTNTPSLNVNTGHEQGSRVKQGEGNRNLSYLHGQGRLKHSVSNISEHSAKKGRDLGMDRVNSLKETGPSCSYSEEPVTPKNLPLLQAEVDAFDDVILPFIMGTCEDMCPLKEREQRERLRDLAVFERVNRNPSRTSRELAVKKFCRSFTGVKLLSDDVRPLRTLWRTLQYLLNLLDDSEFPFDVVHNFLFDRTRAIRQELGMQRLANSQAINMYEEIVRFHILSEHELNQRGSGRHISDSHLNLQQLSKSLLSLFDLYRLNRKEKLANEAEFRAYYVLLNLGNSSNHQADSLSVWFGQCPAGLLKSWELRFSRSVLRCYCLGNYRGFFQLVQEATFLQGCLMELHFNEVRLRSLLAMNQGGYKLHPIPLVDIAKELLMKEGDLEELCNLCGLSTGMDASRVRCLFVKQAHFSAPKELPSYRCPCILNKRPASYYEEVTGTRQRL